MNISLHGLSQIYLDQVKILRSANLTEMEISAEYMLGDLVMKGMYNATGHLGTMWLQIPFDSDGDKPFNITVNSARLVPRITIDARAACDPEQNLRITEFTLPLLYDSVDSEFDNLDSAFETIFQGIVIFILESQNIVFINAMRNFLSSALGNIMCP